MKNLILIKVKGIYNNSKGEKSYLPKHLALLAKDLEESWSNLVNHLKKDFNVELVLTDMFRTWQIQEQLYIKKPKLAKPSGSSWHEAGRAVDIALQETLQNKISYKLFREVLASHKWNTLKSVVNQNSPEAWHFQHTEPYPLSDIKDAIEWVDNLKPTK